MEAREGVEPPIYCLQDNCLTIGLSGHKRFINSALPSGWRTVATVLLEV